MADDSVYSSAAIESPKLDETLSKRVEDLRAGVATASERMWLASAPKWLPLYTDKSGSSNNNSGTAPGRSLDGMNSEEFSKAFNRDALNQKYVSTVQSEGGKALSYRDAQAIKVQIDLMAAMERELRMRYRSRVRMAAHGTARLLSHGLPIGPIAKGSMNFIKILMDRR